MSVFLHASKMEQQILAVKKKGFCFQVYTEEKYTIVEK